METAIQTPQVDHTARTHHKYGMSKLQAYRSCAGYEGTDTTSAASEAGTRLHEFMEQVTEEMQKTKGKALATLGSLINESKILVDDSDRFYLEYCCKELDNYWPHKTKSVHSEIQVTVLNPDDSKLNSGYLDVAVMLSEEVAVIFDWKFGWIPVPTASDNMQGMGYALGVFIKFPRLQKIGVVFAQPKLHATTKFVYSRSDMSWMYSEIRKVIDDTKNPSKTLRLNPYCDFCKHNGSCIAQIGNASKAVVKYEALPLPDSFDGLQISTPQQGIAAMYIIERLEGLISKGNVRQRVLEMAKEAGGTLEAEIMPGVIGRVEVRSRKSNRVANSPALIAEQFEPHFGLERAQALVLSACEPSIGALESAFSDAYVEKCTEAANAILAAAEQQANACTDKKQAKAILNEAKAHAKEVKSTKKAAGEMMTDMLTSEGLITRSEAVIEYPKLQIEKVVKSPEQITA